MIDRLLIAAKGVAMGAADVVPGVSGGTIALLTGIYPRLINAITGVNIKSLKQLFSGDFKGFWKAIDGNFILPLLFGIGTAFALLAHWIKHAIEFYPIPTWSFFFGLIVASAVLIIKQIPNKKPINFAWLLPGLIFGYWIGSLTSIPFPSSETAVFIAGMIAICAMILPGISGSFILLLLGMYEILLSAVTDKNFTVIIIFMGGAVVGLLIFSRIIKWILKHFYQPTLLFLSGLMLGSLVKVWPWKTLQDSSKFLSNILPNAHPDSQLSLSISLMVFAIIIVFLVDYLGKKYQPK